MNKIDSDELIEKTKANLEQAINDGHIVLAKRYADVLLKQIKLSKIFAEKPKTPSFEDTEQEREELMEELNRRLDRIAEANMGID